MPASLSATQLLRLADDPDGFAQELARPMPRPPAPAARRGTRFHAWVESRFEELPLPMLGPDELPGGDESDADIADERDLAALKEAFERTPYARPHPVPRRDTVPDHPRGPGDPRPDRRRVPQRGPRRVHVRDRRLEDDPNVPSSREGTSGTPPPTRSSWPSTASPGPNCTTYRSTPSPTTFLFVRSGEAVRPDHLPGRAELEQLLLDEPPPMGR